ncbi:MAG: NADH-quinone oxidoreductase subunit N [Thermodesulfobacteriota bacterium]
MGVEHLPVALSVIRPELILAGTALVCIALDLLYKPADKMPCWAIAFFGCLAALAATIAAWGTEQEAFSRLVRMDNLSNFFAVVFLMAGMITLCLSANYVKREGLLAGEYYTLLLVSMTGMLFMAQANDLMTVYLGIEIMSIPVYVLVAMMKKSPKSPEAGLKYLLLGGFASAILLFGIAFLYGAVGTTQLADILRHAPRAMRASDPLFLAGVGFLLVGMGFKVSLVPFHMWTPDAYEGAPTSVTAFMSVAVKAAGFSILIRVIVLTLHPMAVTWSQIFWWLAVVTMVLGNVVALVQENIKRMLAYSSIAHAGYVLVALTTGNEVGIQAALIYLFIYSLMNLGAFGVIIAMSRERDQGVEIKDFTGIAREHPMYALAMAVFMFSLAGVPPTAGFIGKFYAFSAAVKAGYVGLAVIGVLMSAVSAYFYLRVLVGMYMKEPEAGPEYGAGPWGATVGAGVVVSLWICSLSILVLGIWPGWLNHFAHQALQGLGHLL